MSGSAANTKDLPLFHVDAFTTKLFAGNPAAVCLLERTDPRRLDEAWLLAVAAEMNLPETAFLYAEPEGAAGPDGFRLRWFTPTREVQLCGHATLASAHVLWTEGRLPRTQIARLNSRSGVLVAHLADVSSGSENRVGNSAVNRELSPVIELELPTIPEKPWVVKDQSLADALSLKPIYVGRAENGNTLVELASEEELRKAAPKMAPLFDYPGGLILTARAAARANSTAVSALATNCPAAATGEIDFVSRFFSPNEVEPEDPVTGSAHCTLGPYWAAKIGKTEMRARQLSRRGGELTVRVRADRVDLIGQAVTVSRGMLLAERR